MERIGIRELRQHASRWLKRVAAGESFEVTDRGRTVALLVPKPEREGLQELVATGRARPGAGHLRDLGAPRAPSSVGTLPGAELDRSRADER